jgi:hypothetical protein
MTDQTGPQFGRTWTNHDGGYYVCSHLGCKKKADILNIPDHDCCGRCRQSRDCLRAALANYAGPGTFPHRYWELAGRLRPGVCATCGEPPEAH